MSKSKKVTPTTEVAIIQPAELAVQQPTADPFLSMIERAAEKSDVATIERLFELRAKEQVRSDEQEFNAAMVRVQSQVKSVAPDLFNPQTKSKYASYDALNNKVRPFYSAEGFALSFDTADSPKEDHVRTVCYVTRGAYTRTYHRDVPVETTGAKGNAFATKIHATAIAESYGNRYILKGIFGISIGEDDRDGNEPPVPIDEAQLDYLQKRILDEGIDVVQFLKACKVEFIEQILSVNFVHVVSKMDERKAKRAEVAA